MIELAPDVVSGWGCKLSFSVSVIKVNDIHLKLNSLILHLKICFENPKRFYKLTGKLNLPLLLSVIGGQEEKQEVKQRWEEESKTEKNLVLEANSVGFGKLTS